MKLEYRFVNGEKTIIEVDGDFEKIMFELNRNLYNNNHTETRQHISLSNFSQDGEELIDADAYLEEKILNQLDKEILYKAISKLNADEQVLVHSLYLSDNPITPKEYASAFNIEEKSIQEKSYHILEKLRNLIEKEF